jgi:hypothetical protein
VDGHDEKDVLEEITRGGLPSHVRAELVADAPAEPPGCPALYSRAGKTYMDRCQLERGHAPRATGREHYSASIGWWAAS